MLLVAGAVAPLVVGVAFATPPTGLKSQLLARGSAGELTIRDSGTGLRIEARRPTDVAVVQATLEPGGSTGWHGHPGPSIVVVKAGVVTMYEPSGRDHGDHEPRGRGEDRRCAVRRFKAGTAFAHPEDVHNFVNETDTVAEFYVVYMVPAAATPLLNDAATAPSRCSRG